MSADLSFLPAVNAALNASATVLLAVGWRCIKRGNVTAHRRLMLTATAVSGLFLISYVTHYVWRASVEGGSHKLYHGIGLSKSLYYAILLSHLLLAMTVPFFAIRLVFLGLKNRISQHRRLARIGFPIWMYVSVTGLIIYVMLYHLNPTP